jgi:hypothetical protein
LICCDSFANRILTLSRHTNYIVVEVVGLPQDRGARDNERQELPTFDDDINPMHM